MNSASTHSAIAFIGGGNMARALIGGLLQAGRPASSIRVADPEDKARQAAAADFGVAVTGASAEAVRGTEVVVLAVKPQIMSKALADIAGELMPGALVISVAAGVTLHALEAALGSEQAIVRAMPNTPALYGAGMTGIVANAAADASARALAEGVLAATGQVLWLDDEVLMDVVTAVSGSGPAYFFALAEQLALAGERAGLKPAAAAQLARQTAFGAGLMLVESGLSAAELRMRVTSPGGTTQAALESFGRDGFEGLIERALAAAIQRGQELGKNQ